MEIDELCINKRENLWLWTAVSRYTGQILAFVIGSRAWEHLERLWSRVPRPWRRRLVYTDGYEAYGAFFPTWQYRLCQKGDGGTCTVEGVNTSLRHRCGALVRRSLSRCRDASTLERSVGWAVRAHNAGWRRRWHRRLKIAGAKPTKSTQEKR